MTDPIQLTSYSKGGGCGCKIAPSVLQEIIASKEKFSFENLLVGNESSDDAAVYQLNHELAVISTTDFFLPIVNDPFDFGRIAAANAISDVYAMGGTPVMAIAILGFPVEKLPLDVAQKILEGGRSVCREANIPLAGGHTIDSTEPIFGLSVTGTVAVNKIKKNNGAKEGDLLFLTKPLGTGMLSTALKRGSLNADHYHPLIASMTRLNSVGEALGNIPEVHAMTDVTGFGLAGHLMEICEGSELNAEIEYAKIQKLPGVDDALKNRTVPDATFRNWNSYSKNIEFEKGVNVMEAFNLLPDPQTNGGLLIAASASAKNEIGEILKQHGLENFSEPIGRFVRSERKRIFVGI
jgi:selenide, water dikinase